MLYTVNTSISSIMYDLIVYVLTSIGLWKMYGKMGLRKIYAFVPIYRIYLVADYLDRDEEGMNYVNASVIYYGISIVLYLFPQWFNGNHERTAVFLIMVGLIAEIASLLYSFRIFMALARYISLKRRWLLLWIPCWWFLPCVPALLCGFTKLFNPDAVVKEGEQKNTAGESGLQAKILKRGLTVNLKERSVRNHGKKRVLLRDIHLNIEPGKMVLLLGGSGAGKTTFLNAVTGYEQADAKIYLDGDDVYKSFASMKYKIGFVPQQDLIRYDDTVEKTLTDAASLRLPTDVTRKEKTQRVKEVLEIFGLTPVRHNIVTKQSGGQKKRISIAMEYISDPSLFILDEPDSGLDGILARDLMRRLHDISRQGKIVIVITHTPDRVIDLFDDVIVLGKDADRTGRLVFYGSIDKAWDFFETDKMENIIRKINCTDEGGEGLADTLIEKYAEVRHGEE